MSFVSNQGILLDLPMPAYPLHKCMNPYPLLLPLFTPLLHPRSTSVPLHIHSINAIMCKCDKVRCPRCNSYMTTYERCPFKYDLSRRTEACLRFPPVDDFHINRCAQCEAMQRRQQEEILRQAQQEAYGKLGAVAGEVEALKLDGVTQVRRGSGEGLPVGTSTQGKEWVRQVWLKGSEAEDVERVMRELKIWGKE